MLLMYQSVFCRRTLTQKHYFRQFSPRFASTSLKKKLVTKKPIPKPKALPKKPSNTQIYFKMDHQEHVITRPDMYIGSIQPTAEPHWVFSPDKDKLEKRPINFIPGLFKIFDEILVNAADNYQRDHSQTFIKVTIDKRKNTITVYNDGQGIPVEIHETYEKYIPEFIFGDLLSGSSFGEGKSQVIGGRNGLGAKLTNIFSNEFVVETASGKVNGKAFKQTFFNNMKERTEPIITDVPANENWTRITFKPDLDIFGIKELTADLVALMERRVHDIAACNPYLKVYFNSKKISYSSFFDYAQNFNDEKDNVISETLFDLKKTKRCEIGVSKSEDASFQQISFVNSIFTSNGGTHVNSFVQQIINYLEPIVSGQCPKRSKTKVFIHNTNAKDSVKPNMIKNNMKIFVNSLISDPAFDSQQKNQLITTSDKFGFSTTLSEDFLKQKADHLVAEKSGIIEKVIQQIQTSQRTKLIRIGGQKKQQLYGFDKLVDANNAGGRHSALTTLILTEGDSAKALAVGGLSVVGHDNFGVFPLRGKLLNVSSAKQSQILQNEEIRALIRIIGLKPHTVYENTKSLRYGRIMLMMDQDDDGSHIKGLFINFMHHFWPSLLQIPGFLVEFMTPLIKATKGDQVVPFFSTDAYKEWRDLDDHKSWKIKYYKGLGTSTTLEAREYFSQLQKHIRNYRFDNDADSEAIKMAFSKSEKDSSSSVRKEWIQNFKVYQKEKSQRTQPEDLQTISISDFINLELINFGIANCLRSLPSVVDGLKPGQRKILFSCFKRNLNSEIRVAQLAGYVSEKSAYHHGEASLHATIINLAQNFVGSNNLNLLHPGGQFGTRLEGGKDAASPRYIHVSLTPLSQILFNKFDFRLLDYNEEDGEELEPIFYVPILPLVLVNGVSGIGMGWSCFAPNFNPTDIIANIRNLFNGNPMIPMTPWYRGFKGEITWDELEKLFIVNGKWSVLEDNVIEITELPIGRWTQQYKVFLDKLVSDGKINWFKDYNTDTTVKFHISVDNLSQMNTATILRFFKLSTTLSCSNMHIFSSEGHIKKYQTPEEILEEFYHVRLSYYEKRKAHLLEQLEMERKRFMNQSKFIGLVLSQKIDFRGKKKEEFVQILTELGFSRLDEEKGFDYLLNLKFWNLTSEHVEDLERNVATKSKLIDELYGKSAQALWEDDLVQFEKGWTLFQQEMEQNGL